MKQSELELLLRIDEKVDAMREKLHEYNIELVKYNSLLEKNDENLAIHMKRSDRLEENMELLNEEIKPILKGMAFLKSLGKFVSWVGGVVYTISKFFR